MPNYSKTPAELQEPTEEPSLDELWNATEPLSDEQLASGIRRERELMREYVKKQNERRR